MENKLLLNKLQIEYLSNLPEQGMGYQIVDVTLKGGKVLTARIVINSTYLKLLESEEYVTEDIEKIELHIK